MAMIAQKIMETMTKSRKSKDTFGQRSNAAYEEGQQKRTSAKVGHEEGQQKRISAMVGHEMSGQKRKGTSVLGNASANWPMDSRKAVATRPALQLSLGASAVHGFSSPPRGKKRSVCSFGNQNERLSSIKREEGRASMNRVRRELHVRQEHRQLRVAEDVVDMVGRKSRIPSAVIPPSPSDDDLSTPVLGGVYKKPQHAERISRELRTTNVMKDRHADKFKRSMECEWSSEDVVECNLNIRGSSQHFMQWSMHSVVFEF